MKSVLRFRRSAAPTEADHQAKVSRYFKDYSDSGKSKPAYMLRRPDRSLGALISLCRLRCLRMIPSARTEGIAIRAALLRHSRFWRITGFAAAVIILPDQAGQYSLGAAKQTLRRKTRQAQKLGVTWAEVRDPDERRKLLRFADECEQAHPDQTYRIANPDNSELLDFRLWLAAYAADGRPLLLSVTPVDGEFATLRYFRTLGPGDAQTNARYLMTDVLVEHLVGLGVRYLVDTTNLFWLTNGLRHFQQMVGFSVVRIRVGRPRPGRHAVRQDQPAPSPSAAQPAGDTAASEAPTRAPVAAQAVATSVSPEKGN